MKGLSKRGQSAMWLIFGFAMLGSCLFLAYPLPVIVLWVVCFIGACVVSVVSYDGPTLPPRGLTKEEEELDAIYGEMWREMGE